MNASFKMAGPISKPTAGKSAKRKILLVDDDPAVRQILLRLLENENYFVLAAANGVEALTLANATRFNLALLDLSMPVKDGWETLQQLSIKDPELSIILMTARPDQLFPALASGVDALLEKPLDFAVLFQTIQNLLGKPPETRPERFPGQPPGISIHPAESPRAGR